MADPLSVSASIAGLVSTADSVFRGVFKYTRSAINAKQEVSDLSREINNLGLVLRPLEALCSAMEEEDDKPDPSVPFHVVRQCSATLHKIQRKLTKATESFNNGSKFDSAKRQMKWPFSSSETKELLTELARHNQTMTLALTADTMSKFQLCLTKQEEQGERILSIQDTLRRVEINTKISVDQEKRWMLEFFLKPDVNPQTRLDQNIKLRHPNTGSWLIDSHGMTEWLSNPGSKLWLSGIPGAGKTVLAAAAIQKALLQSYRAPQGDIGVAFFFCDYKNKETWRPVGVLGAIVAQLARQKQEAFELLKAYYEELHPQRALEKAADPDELRATIERMAGFFKQVIVVVDGLDECGDHTEDVVDVLSELATSADNITMALFSRHEFDIKVKLEGDFQHINIAASTGDIELYVAAEMETRIRTGRLGIVSARVKDEIKEKLVHEAKGM